MRHNDYPTLQFPSSPRDATSLQQMLNQRDQQISSLQSTVSKLEMKNK